MEMEMDTKRVKNKLKLKLNVKKKKSIMKRQNEFDLKLTEIGYDRLDRKNKTFLAIIIFLECITLTL